MEPDEVKEFLREVNPEALFADGFDRALVGVAHRCGTSHLALYDRDICIDVLVTEDGMSHEEAEEYFSFNVEGAWVGENTPLFATLNALS